MLRKSTFKSLLAAAAVSMVALQSPAQAASDFATIGGIEAEPMNAAEMEATQGKAYLGVTFDGRYLNWFDDQLYNPQTGAGRPLAAFDTSLPGVQQVIAWVQGGTLPDPSASPAAANNAFYFLLQADPQATNRVTPGIGGCMTANGPGIPGWTIGC